MENFYQRTERGVRTKSTELRMWTHSAQGSLRGESPFAHDPRREQNLFREISLVVSEVAMEYMEDFKDELNARQNIFFGKTFELLTHLLLKNQSVSFLSCIFGALAYLVTEYRR